MSTETPDLPPAIDQTVIDKLKASIKKKEPILEVFDIFEKNAAEKIKKFQSASGAGDYYLVHLTAHAIKGSAYTVGAVYFAELCEALEIMTDPEDPTFDSIEVAESIKQIDKEFDRVIQEIFKLRSTL